MPADEVFELQELIKLAVEKNFHTVAMDQGILIPSPPGGIQNPFDAIIAGTGQTADEFGAGYNAGTGTSTMAFTLDFSILYGDGVSGDILTG